MENNKSPEDNGITEELYEVFWDNIKISLLLPFKKNFLRKELSIFTNKL